LGDCVDRVGLRGLAGADRDQKDLALAHGEVVAEAVPIGQRADIDVVETRDGIGGLAALDLVACRLRSVAGLVATGAETVGCRLCGGGLARFGAVDGA
jgi:hypothetical protein